MNSALGYSGVEWMRVDPKARTAMLVRNQVHPNGMNAFALGNTQALPNGETAVGWGTAPLISKLTASGELLYDASLRSAPTAPTQPTGRTSLGSAPDPPALPGRRGGSRLPLTSS